MIMNHNIFQIIISLENWEEKNKVALGVELSIKNKLIELKAALSQSLSSQWQAVYL